jgi:hypothetical protein
MSSINANGHEFSSIPYNGDMRRLASLPLVYYSAMKANEKYILFWPGGHIERWFFGGADEYESRPIDAHEKEHAREPKVILAPSNALEFTVYEETQPWPPTRLSLSSNMARTRRVCRRKSGE